MRKMMGCLGAEGAGVWGRVSGQSHVPGMES